MPDVNNILMELMLLVDNDNPETKDVTLKLNEFSEIVASGLPDVRETALELGAYAVICRAWIYCCYSGSNSKSLAPGAKQCRTAVLKALIALTPGNPDIIDDVGWQIIENAIDKTLPESTLVLALKLLRNVFIKSEDNREQFCWNLDSLEPLLGLADRPKVSNGFLLDWCAVLKSLMMNDDISETVNRAAERKRAIASLKILPNLASRLCHHTDEEDEEDIAAMNGIVILLGSMAVTDDLCLEIETGNALLGIHNLLKRHIKNKGLMRNTIVLLRNLCVNQEIRDKAATYALMKHVIDTLTFYQKNKSLVQPILYCCVYMTNKSPCQVAQFIVKGGLQITLQLMTTFATDMTILKPACLTLRNVLENGEDSKEKMKDMGYMMFLNNLMSTAPQLSDLFIAPLLRDLGYSSVSFLEEHVRFLGESASRYDIPFEPKVGRKSVVVDEDKILKN